jgi:phosphoglucosamine mutase
MGKLFSADGIRGTTHEVTFDFSRRLGQAIGTWIHKNFSDKEPILIIGTDTRESCGRLRSALEDGLTKSGVRVYNVGTIPTSAVSYLIAEKTGTFHGGVMITASHNPIEENGIKIFDQRGMKLGVQQENDLESIFFSDERLFQSLIAQDVIDASEYAHHYQLSLARPFHNIKPKNLDRILVDCANGSASRIVPEILKLLHIPFSLINDTPDGININVQSGSEHYRKYPKQFAHLLQQYKAGIGVALDGDADRVVFFDKTGKIYDGDMLLSFIALKLKREQALNGNIVVSTQMSNTGLKYFLLDNKIGFRQVQNGDKYISEELIKDNLALGGEQIGHIIYRDNDQHITGDGIRTMLIILSELSQNPNMHLADLAPEMKKFPQINVSIHLHQRTQTTAENIPDLAELLSNLWVLVADLTRLECRPASTEPIYRIMLEARETPIHILAQHALHLARPIQRHFNIPLHDIPIRNCVDGGLIDLEQ